MAAETLEHGARLLVELGLVLDEREDGDLDRGDGRVEVHDRANVGVALAVDELLLLVGIADEGEREAVGAGGRLDDVGDVAAFEEMVAEGGGVFGRLAARGPSRDGLRLEGVLRVRVELGDGEAQRVVHHEHALAGERLVLREVEVRAGGDAFELLDAERECVLDVDAGAGVVGEFLLGLPVLHEGIAGQADRAVPAQALLDPILVPDFPAPVLLRRAGEVRVVRQGGDLAADDLDGLVGTDEELQLHLLELARAEGEVAGVDLVAEALAGLRHAERDGLARGRGDVEELREDRLGRLGAEVGDGGVVLDGSDVRLEHEVEGARLGEVLGAAGGAGDALGQLPVLAVGDQLPPLLLAELVGAVALLAVLAVDHGVGEAAEVAGGLPDARVHDDRGVEADDVLTAVDGEAPPGVADVALELGAHRAVVPEAVDAAVDFGAGEDEAAALAQRDDGFEVVHGCGFLVHGVLL